MNETNIDIKVLAGLVNGAMDRLLIASTRIDFIAKSINEKDIAKPNRAMYDITENKADLYLLDNAEPNLISDPNKVADYAMIEGMSPDWLPRRSIKDDHFEIGVVELHQGDSMVIVSKHDVVALAKHYELI